MRKANRDAIAGTVAAALAFTGVLYLLTDFTFGTPEAVVAALLFFGFVVWRWWALALYRAWQDREHPERRKGRV
jgi:hypothetical protein